MKIFALFVVISCPEKELILNSFFFAEIRENLGPRVQNFTPKLFFSQASFVLKQNFRFCLIIEQNN